MPLLIGLTVSHKRSEGPAAFELVITSGIPAAFIPNLSHLPIEKSEIRNHNCTHDHTA